MKELKINVNGMSCEGCQNRIINALSILDGINNVTADYKTGIVNIISKKELDISKIKEIIEDLGFDIVKED